MTSTAPLAVAFEGARQIAVGNLTDVAIAVRQHLSVARTGEVRIYESATGRLADIDFSGPDDLFLARLNRRAALIAQPEAADGEEPSATRRRPGRPRLGVVAREVTLLPRHWDWLASQRGGASVALRRLVDEARRNGGDADARRSSQDAAYRFMTSMAGDYPGYEEATRALYAGDSDRFEHAVAAWPVDVRNYARTLAAGAFTGLA
jgi:hypothetical protein